MVRVRIISGEIVERSIEVDEGSIYSDILAALKINPETVIIMVNNRPVPIDEDVSVDHVEILKIVSKG